MDAENVWELELDWDGMKVRDWRQRQLEREGFSEFTAYRIAMNLGADYHKAIDLFKSALARLSPPDAERWVADQLLD